MPRILSEAVEREEKFKKNQHAPSRIQEQISFANVALICCFRFVHFVYEARDKCSCRHGPGSSDSRASP
jgi:hypothetical protein